MTPKILEFPAQALHCRLHDLSAPKGGWLPEHVDVLNQILEDMGPNSDQLFMLVSSVYVISMTFKPLSAGFPDWPLCYCGVLR